MTTNNRISNLVSTQLPFFVRNDHDNFVKFVEAYYEYLEQQGKTVEVAKNLRNYIDVDQSVDVFTEELYDTFIRLIPSDVVADRSLILKHIKDFYAAKGSEKSIAFLLNIITGDGNTSFYYPKRDVLRASDGKWFIEKSLKVQDVRTDNVANADITAVNNFIGTRITGQTSNATAIVEKVDTFYEGGTLVKELKISGQERDFSSGEVIRASYNSEGLVRSISANLISGILNTVQIVKSGNNYVVGSEIPIESNSGTGGVVIISSVTTGNISSLFVQQGGAGFQNNQFLSFTSATGSGANANVNSVQDDGTYHPASYNIVGSIISLEANTPINNTKYSNLNSSITNPANSWISNSMTYWTYANTGPVTSVLLLNPGSGYTSLPSIGVQANTVIRQIGILGKMNVVSGGTGYANNEIIHFQNVLGGKGTGALANIYRVNATGSIQEVRFIAMPGHIIGGAGYDQNYLPRANIISNTGVNGNVVVTSLLGYGDVITASSDSVGQILALTIVSGGTGYTTAPTLNLMSIGDGTAQATATIVTGAYTYPGRYLNDDGHVSSYNYLQDRDYYQNYSYVVRVKSSVERYRKALKDLAHPSGLKFFGEYLYVDDQIINEDGTSTENVTKNTIFSLSSYVYAGNAATPNTINIGRTSHGLYAGNTVYVEFETGDIANIANGILTVSSVINANAYIVRNNVLFNTAYTANGNVYVALYK